jgi:hypothetical protein
LLKTGSSRRGEIEPGPLMDLAYLRRMAKAPYPLQIRKLILGSFHPLQRIDPKLHNHLER